MNTMLLNGCLVLVLLGCVLVSADPDGSKEANPTEKPEKEEAEEGVYKSWQLDTNRFVKVKEYKGKLYVDIREHYEKDGKMLPGKKGILLNLAQFKLFKDAAHDINAVLEQCQGHDPNILNAV